MKRREFVVAATSAAILSATTSAMTETAVRTKPRFTIDLCPGRIGVKADQMAAIDYAARYGFQSVEPLTGSLAKLEKGELEVVLGKLHSRGLVWGAAGLDTNFRGDESTFQSDIRALPKTAQGLQRAGVTRMGTWLSPSHAELTYRENFQSHVRRLREVAGILHDSGIRFGLEYVGPKTSWSAKRFPFIHTLRETLELIGEIGTPNMGIILDSWHWYCAGESVPDLLTLSNEQIVAVDLNDAPAGIDRDQQIDNRRELPTATGVIDLNGFTNALRQLDYDGPVRAEPFNQALNEMADEQAVQATAAAMKKALLG